MKDIVNMTPKKKELKKVAPSGEKNLLPHRYLYQSLLSAAILVACLWLVGGLCVISRWYVCDTQWLSVAVSVCSVVCL